MRLFRVLAVLALLAVGVPAAVHSATPGPRAGVTPATRRRSSRH